MIVDPMFNFMESFFLLIEKEEDDFDTRVDVV